MNAGATTSAGSPPSEPGIVLVPHTHWDREWYRTFQDFQIRLCDLVNRDRA